MHTPLHLPNSPRITLRHILGWSLGFLIVGAIVVYVGYQARFLIAGPQIVLTAEPVFVTSSSTVVLEGRTENITRIHLNGRQIFTDQYGTFAELTALTPGANVITLSAEDRYGRVRDVQRTVVYTP